MFTRALVCPVLVGRDDELSELVGLRRKAARGHGALVLVCGEAGIGKSRLLQSFKTSLRGGRTALGTGLCREFGSRPYGAIQDALQAIGVEAPSAPAPSREEHLARYAQSIEKACRRRHVVLVVEDLHWADEGTLLFLRQMLPAIASMRLLIVATYRTDEPGGVAQLERALSRLLRDRSTHRIFLRRLPPEDMRRLIKLAAEAARTPRPEQVTEIVEGSEGNPFFAEELLKNALEGNGRGLPPTVRATVLERVAGVDARCREILSHASVLGRRFDAQFLADVCGIAIEELLPHLRTLRNFELIDEIEGEPLRFAFRHSLTREAVYGELLAAEVRALHGRILQILEEREQDGYGDLGYHAWAAGDAERAERYNELAADVARGLHAYGDAVRSYQRALTYARDPHVRGRLLIKAAESSGNDGKSAQAMEFYACAIETLRGIADSDRMVQLYQDMSAQARIGGDAERGIGILEDARRTIPAGEARAAATIDVGLAYLWLDRGDVSAAYAFIEKSSAAADSASYHRLIPYAALVAGDVAAWRTASARLLAISRGYGSEQDARARFNHAFGLTILGFDDEAIAEFESLVLDVRRLHLPSLELLASANHALVLARRGRFREGRQLLDRTAALPEPSTTGPVAMAAAAFTIGHALCDEALVERLCSAEILEAAFRSGINTTLGRVAGPWARWLHARGDARGAQAVLERAMPALPSACGATESFIAAAEFGNAATRRQALARIDLLDSMPDVPAYVATAAHLKALRALDEGRVAAASGYAALALERYSGLGWFLHQARCRELLGENRRAVTQYRRSGSQGAVRTVVVAASGTSSAAVLSHREREVAAMVVNGKINRQIAEQLKINQRTVEKYLTSIYGKLGLRNRSELAAFIARL